MARRRLFLWAILALALVILVAAWAVYRWVRGQVNIVGERDASISDITLPPGFVINVFAEGLNEPRFIAFGPDGILYVADMGNGRIVALPDDNLDGLADSIQVFADGLNRPHSLVFHEGAWYIGVPTGIVRIQDTDGEGTADARAALIDDIPTSGHWTRTVAFLGDGRMLLSVGSSCNVCEEGNPQRAAILVYDGPEAGSEQLFATGLRNAVGLAVHPETGELWATNNGRDGMGDELPPDNVYIVREGKEYGWPVCHSGHIVDPDLGFDGACDGVEAPLAELQAHSAPLGLVFYPHDGVESGGPDGGGSFPAEYQGDLFIAYHGSWNRSVPTGYKVVRLPLDGNQPAGPVEEFATGWLDERDGSASGRPVGLAVGPDGSLFVSDDSGGIIYRIRYRGSG
jgi:glucose/arabinose dehydrogenase